MQFADDPVSYFGGDGAAAGTLDAGERERLQQQALSHRLDRLLSRLPPLAALAAKQGLDSSIALDQAPLICFPHSLFKAYDPAWLNPPDFRRMSEWLQQFTTVKLGLPGSEGFTTVDAWFDWLEAERGLDVTHSTGTTGRLSLVVRGKTELWDRHARIRMLLGAWFAAKGFPDDEMLFHVIWPAAGVGRSALLKIAKMWREVGVQGPDAFLSLFENDLGADYELYAIAARSARAQGQLELPQPSSHVERQLAEAEVRNAYFEDYLSVMLDRIDERMRGRRTIVIGGARNVARLAQAGIARGMTGTFGAGSAYDCIGGLKGFGGIPDLKGNLHKFMGSPLALEGYGMTEMNSGFILCPAGRFHVPPWIVAWALNPSDSWKPLPRNGVREGRAAFLDLASTTAWGGLVTADHVEIAYTQCSCGSASPSIAREIKRVLDADGDVQFTPARADAMAAALETLVPSQTAIA